MSRIRTAQRCQHIDLRRARSPWANNIDKKVLNAGAAPDASCCDRDETYPDLALIYARPGRRYPVVFSPALPPKAFWHWCDRGGGKHIALRLSIDPATPQRSW